MKLLTILRKLTTGPAQGPVRSVVGNDMPESDSEHRQFSSVLAIFTPTGDLIDNPSEPQLREIIVEMDWEATWGNDGTVNLGWFRRGPDGVIFNPVEGKPDLNFFRSDPHGMFVSYRDAERREFVPEWGSPEQQMVKHWLGGNAYLFPATAFVPPDRALSIALEFVRSGLRSEAVDWVSWDGPAEAN